MCRMILQIGKQVYSSAYEEYIASTNDYEGMRVKLDVHELNKEKRIKHQDGYGMAWMENGEFTIKHSKLPLFEDKPDIEKIAQLSDLFLIHARRASPGIEVNLKNNHPFIWRDDNKTFIFAHNGTIKSQIDYDESLFEPKGTTDSERYFYMLLTKIRENDWQIEKEMFYPTIKMWNYTSANFILMNKEEVWVGVFYTTHANYYKMKFYHGPKHCVFSSCNLPSLENKRTKKITLEHRTLVYVNLRTKDYKLYKDEKMD